MFRFWKIKYFLVKIICAFVLLWLMQSFLTRNRMSRCVYKYSNLEEKDQIASSTFMPTRQCLRDTVRQTPPTQCFQTFTSLPVDWEWHIAEAFIYISQITDFIKCFFVCFFALCMRHMQNIDSYLLPTWLRVWFLGGWSVISHSCSQSSRERVDYGSSITDHSCWVG